MSKLAYLPLYVRDFLSDPNVIALNWIQQAVYLRLLMLSWEVGPLEAPAPVLARQIGRHEPEAVAEVETVLETCWTHADGHWLNARLEVERDRANGLVAINLMRTKAATEARRQRHDDVTSTSRDQAQAQAQAQAQEKTKNQDTPSLRSGVGAPRVQESEIGASDAAKPRKRSAPFDWRPVLSELPALDTPEVRKACEDFCDARRSKHGAWTPQGMRLAIKRFSGLGTAALVQAFEQATEAPWKTIYATKDLNHNGTHNGHAKHSRRPDGTREGEYAEGDVMPARI